MTDRSNAPTLPPSQTDTVVEVHNLICQLKRERNGAWTAASEQRIRAEAAEAELMFWRRVAFEVSLRGNGDGSIGVDTEGGELIYGAFMCWNLPMTERAWYRSIGALAHALSAPGREPATDGGSKAGDDPEDPR